MTILKLLFVDKTVPFRNVLTDNISTQVKLVEKKESLDNIDLSTVEQVGFIWKNKWRGNNKPFFPRFEYFENKSKKNSFNKRISEIVKNFPNLKYVDLITCDLKENSDWADEFNTLRQSLNTTAEIRYSTNRTGSITSGTDWILEVGKVSILDEYYDGKDIRYNDHLAPGSMQSFADIMNIAGVTYEPSTKTLSFTNNIDIDDNWVPLKIETSDNVEIIDGNNKTIKFTGNNTLKSLFYKETDSDILEIKNLIIDSNTSKEFDGIVSSDGSTPANNVTVKNCGVHTLYPSSENGLIFGAYAAGNPNAIIQTGTATAIACYTTGSTAYLYGGFIFGNNAAYNYGGSGTYTAVAIACYATGNIDYNDTSGCIFGYYTAYNEDGNGTCTAVAIACYTTGNITDNEYGGFIFGYSAVSNDDNGICNAYAIACYATGNIINSNNGGGFIFGEYAGYGDSTNAVAIACYTTGYINDNTQGGFIFGDFCGTYDGKAYAIGCYTTGDIIHNASGNGSFIFGYSPGTDGTNPGHAYAIACYTTGTIDNTNNNYIFGADPGPTSAEECYYIDATSIWKDYNASNISSPDSDIFKYTSSNLIKEQLQLRFFSALPWNPLSPNKQAPFLLDWSKFEQKIIDNIDKIWYIDYTTPIPTDIAGIKTLLKNRNDPTKLLDTFEPLIDTLSELTSNTGLIDNDIIYDKSTNTYQPYSLSMTFGSGKYLVSSRFPIVTEFWNNTDLIDPFNKNFKDLINYSQAFDFWRGIAPVIITQQLNYYNEIIKNNIELPSIEIYKKGKMCFINKEYNALLNYPIDIDIHDKINITFIIPSIINNYELQLNEINNVSIYLTAINDDNLHKLTIIETKIIKNTNSSIMLVGSFFMETMISNVTEIRYSVKINSITVRTRPFLQNESYKYNGISYISISKVIN